MVGVKNICGLQKKLSNMLTMSYRNRLETTPAIAPTRFSNRSANEV